MLLRLVVGFGFFLSGLQLAQAVQEVPAFTDAVVDQAGLLSSFELRQLSTTTKGLQQELGPQIAILIVESLQDEPIESFSIRVADKWKVGDQKRDDGLIIVVAVQDRRMRIEVGQGLEGQVPDALAGRIVDQVLKPAFRRGEFYSGLNGAVSLVAKLVQGDATATKQLKSSRRMPSLLSDIFVYGFMFLFFGLMPVLRMIFWRRGRRFPRSMGSYGWGGSGSGWGGGSGFGGFGGGGGGGFSGGGSSGSW